MSKKVKATVFWGLVSLALLALLAVALREKPVIADLATVSSGPLALTVDEDAITRIKDTYVISSPLAGQLMRVSWKPGDSITVGDTLLTIDPGEPALLDARTEAEAKARVGAALANLQRAASQAEAAQAEVEKWTRYAERDEARLRGRQISQPVLDDTRLALRVAKSNLASAQSAREMAKFEVEQAQAVLTRSQSPQDSFRDRFFKICSPITGVVLRRFIESSTMVAPGQQILEIGDPDSLEIRIDVLSQDAVKIKPGQKAFISNWGGDQEFVAYVRRVEPSAFTKVSTLGVDEQRVFVYADLEENALSGGLSLGDGYRVEARIVVWEKDSVIKIPSGALFRSGQDWSVYVVENNRARMRHIQVGKNSGTEAEILEGLSAGETVVLHPGDRVKEGTLLKAEP